MSKEETYRPRMQPDLKNFFEPLVGDIGWVGIADKLRYGEPREVTPAEIVILERQLRAQTSKTKDAEGKYKEALKMLDQLQWDFDTLAAIKEPIEVLKIHNEEKIHKKGDAIAMLLWSDWHVEERVDPTKVNFLNEYTPDIAQKRAVKCVQNGLKLVRKERQDVNIDTLVIWLGGDFISGYIHQELMESNYLSPTEAIRFAKKLIISGLEFLLEHGNFKHILVQCNDGNHGRNTHKTQVSTRNENSLEYMMYLDIQEYFSKEPKITFHVPRSTISYIQLFDKYIVRTWHGDNIKFQGGIGGIGVPLHKLIHRLDQQKVADYNFVGHYHQFSEPTKNCLMNGSLIGYSPYAQIIGAAPEPPVQGFRLLDYERGFTVKIPIFCQ